jgi:hypothetical protein
MCVRLKNWDKITCIHWKWYLNYIIKFYHFPFWYFLSTGSQLIDPFDFELMKVIIETCRAHQFRYRISIQISLSMNTCNFIPVFKPHTHKLYILGHCCCLFILLTIRCLRWIICHCLIYPRRCIYNACCISTPKYRLNIHNLSTFYEECTDLTTPLRWG